MSNRKNYVCSNCKTITQTKDCCPHPRLEEYTEDLCLGCGERYYEFDGCSCGNDKAVKVNTIIFCAMISRLINEGRINLKQDDPEYY